LILTIKGKASLHRNFDPQALIAGDGF